MKCSICNNMIESWALEQSPRCPWCLPCETTGCDEIRLSPFIPYCESCDEREREERYRREDEDHQRERERQNRQWLNQQVRTRDEVEADEEDRLNRLDGRLY